jgi:hypothetical protein
MKNLEHVLQTFCVSWFRNKYPELRMLIWSTPNGGKRSKGEAKRLKKEGVLSGVADLTLSIPNDQYHGFFIEMKIEPNKQSENQEHFQKAVEKQKYKYSVIFTFEDFKKEVTEYINNR